MLKVNHSLDSESKWRQMVGWEDWYVTLDLTVVITPQKCYENTRKKALKMLMVLQKMEGEVSGPLRASSLSVHGEGGGEGGGELAAGTRALPGAPLGTITVKWARLMEGSTRKKPLIRLLSPFGRGHRETRLPCGSSAGWKNVWKDMELKINW